MGNPGKHFLTALVWGFFWLFFVTAAILLLADFVNWMFGLELDPENGIFGTIVGVLLFAVFWVFWALGFVKSRKDEIRGQEAEASRRRAELAQLREEVKQDMKEMLDDLRKDSSGS